LPNYSISDGILTTRVRCLDASLDAYQILYEIGRDERGFIKTTPTVPVFKYLDDRTCYRSGLREVAPKYFMNFSSSSLAQNPCSFLLEKDNFFENISEILACTNFSKNGFQNPLSVHSIAICI